MNDGESYYEATKRKVNVIMRQMEEKYYNITQKAKYYYATTVP